MRKFPIQVTQHLYTRQRSSFVLPKLLCLKTTTYSDAYAMKTWLKEQQNSTHSFVVEKTFRFCWKFLCATSENKEPSPDKSSFSPKAMQRAGCCRE